MTSVVAEGKKIMMPFILTCEALEALFEHPSEESVIGQREQKHDE